MRTSSRVALLLVVVLGTLLACVAPAAADVFYVYDDLGRLIAVIDPASDTAVYSYDAVGNLLGVTRHSSAQVSIIDFKPKSGPVGTSVAIQGTGFSATASQNTVTFNGTAATVTSATTTELVATVPVGANTGPIGVTAPGGSATSNAAFTVTSTSGAPTITSFTPTIGAPGDAVTVTGTNFDPTLLNNKLGFNATHPRLGRVTAATATALTVTVPPGATSGRLRVATEAGAAESVADFFAAPAPYPAASVVFTGRIAIGGPSLTAPIGTAGKIGLVVFDGTVGQRLSLGITNSNFNGGVTVYRPDGTLLMPQGPLDFPPLPVSGTYTIQLGNSFSGTGSLTLTLSEEVTGTITVGGPSVPVSITRPGQRARLTFPGTAGQRLNLRMGSVTIWESLVSLLNPDGTALGATTSVTLSGNDLNPPALPVTGTYTVLVDPTSVNTGNMTLTLSEELTGTITVGGPSVSLSISRAGQRARLTFQGTAGQRLSAGASALTITTAMLSILNPDGTTLASGSVGAPGGAVDSPTLAVTGTYTLLVDPTSDSTGNITLTLSEEVTGPISVDGASVTVSITRAGQRARLTFSGTAGQRLSLGLTASTITSYATSVLNPDGSTLVFPLGFGTADTALDMPALPSTGTYSVLVDPGGVATGNITLTLSQEVTGTITIDGPAVTASVTRSGQRARLTFSGTAGQRLSLALTGPTLTSAAATILNPSGATFAGPVFTSPGGSVLDTAPLPSTGSYAILVDPGAAYTGSVTLTLSAEVTGTITPGGPSFTVSITRVGQRARLSFSGTAGQRVSVGGGSGTITQTDVFVLNPNGSFLGGGAAFMASGGFLDTKTLGTTGTYALLLDPTLLYTGDKTVTLYNVPADATGTLTVNGAAVPVSIGVSGQTAQYTFSGTSGQAITVRVANSTVGCLTVNLFRPDNVWVATLSPCGATGNLAHTPTMTGTYTVTVDPSGANTGTFDLSVTNP